MRKFRWAALAVVAAVGLAACGSSSAGNTSSGATSGAGAAGGSGGGSAAGSGKVTKVHLGYVPYDDDAALFLGIKKGYFKKRGLDISLTPAQKPSTIIAGMVSGHEQFGFVTTNILLDAVQRGQAIKCVSSVDGGQTTNPAHDGTELVAGKNSGVTSIKGLQHKTVAVVQLHSLNSADVKEEVIRHGGNPNTVHLLQLPFPQMPAALQSGRVAAAIIVSPFLQSALHNGAKVLTHPNLDLFPNGTITCFAASDKYIKSNPGVVRSFQEGMLQSIAYTKNHQQEALATLPLHLKVTPAEAKQQVLSANFNPQWNPASVLKQEQILRKFGDLSGKIPTSKVLYPLPPSG